MLELFGSSSSDSSGTPSRAFPRTVFSILKHDIRLARNSAKCQRGGLVSVNCPKLILQRGGGVVQLQQHLIKTAQYEFLSARLTTCIYHTLQYMDN